MPAGNKREILAFDKRGDMVDTGHGQVPGDWVEQFKTSANMRYLRGSEPVLAQRLTGDQPVVIVVHRFSKTEEVTPAWRIRNTRNGEIYSIKSQIRGERPTQDIELLCGLGGLADDD